MHFRAFGIPGRCRVSLRQSVRLVFLGSGLVSLTCRHASRRCKQSAPLFQCGIPAVFAVRLQHGKEPVLFRTAVRTLVEGKKPLLSIAGLQSQYGGRAQPSLANWDSVWQT